MEIGVKRRKEEIQIEKKTRDPKKAVAIRIAQEDKSTSME